VLAVFGSDEQLKGIENSRHSMPMSDELLEILRQWKFVSWFGEYDD